MAARTRAVAGLQGSPRRFKSRPRCSLRTHQSTRPRDVFRWSAGGNTHPDGAVWFIALAAELSRLQAGHAAFERRTLFRAGNHCGAAGPQKLCQAPDDVVSPRAGCPLDCRFWLQSGSAETGDGPDQGKGLGVENQKLYRVDEGTPTLQQHSGAMPASIGEEVPCNGSVKRNSMARILI